MISSSPMADISNKPNVLLSEEVQDALHLAKKAAPKGKTSPIADRYLLLGLLQINRLFTRLDALLKQSGSSHKRLFKLYQQEKTMHQAVDPLPTMALDEAIKAATSEKPAAKPKVEIEHLLMGLLASNDPLVQTVFVKGGLTQESLRQAIPEVNERSPMRLVLYCLRETLEVVVVVLLLLIIIRQGIGELRLIPSESMIPTLQVGDRIVVEKLTHWFRKPQRGDVLVFYPPEPQAILRHDPWSVFLRLTGISGLIYDKESGIDTAFIKRAVGVPGDMIEIRPGKGVWINGQLLDEPYVNEVAATCTFVSHCGPVRVPPKMYFMMGDNRNHSMDSRYWYFLPEDRIIGRAVFRIFPFDKRIGPLPSPPYHSKPDPSHNG